MVAANKKMTLGYKCDKCMQWFEDEEAVSIMVIKGQKKNSHLCSMCLKVLLRP